MALRTPYFIAVTAANVVKLQLVEASITGVAAELGLTKAPADGSVPAGKVLVGSGKLAAMQAGCFGINLVYAKTAAKNQTAKVLCSPTMADTVFQAVKGKKYRTFDIVEARVPRRRTYTF